MPLNDESQEIIRIQNFFNNIADSAAAFGGMTTARFSQVNGAVGALTRTDRNARRGICLALVHRWIASHANGGSIWNEIFNNEGNIKIEEIKNLMEEQKNTRSWGSFRRQPYVHTQNFHSEIYLFRRGVVRRQGINSGLRIFHRGGELQNPDLILGMHIGNEIENGPRNGYRLIVTYGPGRAHAFCAWVGGRTYTSYGDVAFFDPNFGEVWFDRIDNFRLWYNFVWQSIYGRHYGKYEIRDFALKAGHVDVIPDLNFGII